MRYRVIVYVLEVFYMTTEYAIIEKWFNRNNVDQNMREWMLFIYNTDTNYWGNQSLWKLFDYCTENGEWNPTDCYEDYYNE